jgi:peptide/nickel transport system substrate-binding protein
MTDSTRPGEISRRNLIRRASLLGLVMAGGPAFLAACSTDTGGTASTTSAAATASGATPSKGGTLKAALTGEPDSLDPAVSSVYTGAQVYDNIFSKLLTIDPSGSFVPRLATKWTATDATTWTVDLVDSAYFHNGEKFTSADVKYTFERILNPKTASAYTALYTAIASIETPTPTQVVFKLKTPYGPFLTNLANNGEIVNQKAIESSDPARKPVGTGPFQFVEWVQGDHITLKRFDKYFEAGLPFVDEIDFKFLLVDQSRIDALASGEINWVDAVPLQQIATLKNDSRFTYVTSPVAGIPDFLALNTKKAPFDKLEVRQATAPRSAIWPTSAAARSASRRSRAARPGTTARTRTAPRPTSTRARPCSPRRATPTVCPSSTSASRSTPSSSRPARSSRSSSRPSVST